MSLGKTRSLLGNFMDQRGVKQRWLADKSEVNKSTISLACNDAKYIPSGKTMQKIIKALRQIDPTVRAEDFWEL